MSQRKAALYYSVPRSTLQDRAKGRLTRGDAHVHERLLTKPQEDSLAKRGIPLSLTTIGSYAAEIYGAPLGVTWPT
ncbi:hypothetical protein DFH08DRAFT_881034, partial [Mycena albidolilacea]